MKHKVKVTVLDKKLYPELQQQYLADPESGDRKSTRLNSSHRSQSRMPSSA